MTDASLTEALMAAMSEMTPVLDAADGMRADLERRGWSPTAAESVAQQWLQGAIAHIWRAA